MEPFGSAHRATRFDSASTGLIESRQVLAGTGTLVSIQGFNNADAARYVMLFDAESVPEDGVVPVAVIKAAPGANFYMEVPKTGVPFHRGIAVAVSTTATTLTQSGTAEVLVWGSIVGDVA